jgi:hypothetical protein
MAHITLGLSALAVPPLWLLHRDGQLFYGGTTGLIPDIFGSLAAGTLHGAEYHPVQSHVWVVSALTIVAGSAVAALAGRAMSREADARLLVVSTVTGLVLAQALVLHEVFAVPLPRGRTALFILPLLMTCGALLAERVYRSGRAGGRFAHAAAALLAVLGGVHLWTVANVSYAIDWRGDSATPAMIDAALTLPRGSTVIPGTVRVGLDWWRFPVARYYAGRTSRDGRRCDVVVHGSDGLPVDAVYRDAFATGATAFAVFPWAGTALSLAPASPRTAPNERLDPPRR